MSKSFYRPLIPIFLVVVVDILGFTIVLPLLPFYAEKYGATPAVVGLLSTTYAVCQLISGPILGRISDRVGRRPMLIVSQLGTFFGFVILANAKTLAVIFLSRVIDGATAGNLSLAQAHISDVTEPQHRAKAFGVIGIAFGLSFLVGPAFSGYLSQYGYHYPAWAAAMLSFGSVMATTFLLPSGRPAPGLQAAQRRRTWWQGFFDVAELRDLLSRPGLGARLSQFFLFNMAFSAFVSGFALYAERRYTAHGRAFSAREVGYLYAFSGLLAVVIQGGLIGWLVRRFGEARLVVSGFFAMALGYLAMGWAATLGQLLPVQAVAAFGSSTLRPSLTSLVTQRVPRHEQGLVLGWAQSLASIAQILAPAMAGYLIGQGDLSWWAGFTASFAVVGWAWGLWSLKRAE
jgi:MFS family permease